MATSSTKKKKNTDSAARNLAKQLEGLTKTAKGLGINTSTADSVVAQTKKEGSKSFTGSSYDTPLPPGTPSSARGDDFAIGFEAELAKNGRTMADVDNIVSEADYNAGQSNTRSGGAYAPPDPAAITRAKQMAARQTSAMTSFAFNPEVLKRTQRAVDKFNFALNEADKDPFEPKEYKDENKNSLLDITSKELGRLFTNPNDIYNSYQTNPQFKAVLDKFIKAGGSMESIAKNVTAPASGPGIGTREYAIQDLVRQGVTDPAKIQNYINFYEDGSPRDNVSIEEVNAALSGKNNQSPSDYLSSLSNPNANQEAERKALDELSPESAIAQEEIARNANIPNELRQFYFGDEKTLGLQDIRRQQAEEEIRILTEKEKDDKRSARDRSQLSIERNKVEAKAAEAKIEQNRLAARNYMTSKLAQLGALQTTGAAPLALQTLETQYQGRVQELKSKLSFANKELELDLADKIDTIEYDTDSAILKIQEDLTKDSETVMKEVMKEQQAADKQIYAITEQYARRLRERTTKFSEDLKSEAEKNAKAFADIASGGIDFTAVGGVKSKSKIVSETESKLEASRGTDGYVNSATYIEMYKDWIKRGGNAKSFVAQFPPKLYANPEDQSLPPALRYARESQTVSREEVDDVLSQIENWGGSEE